MVTGKRVIDDDVAEIQTGSKGETRCTPIFGHSELRPPEKIISDPDGQKISWNEFNSGHHVIQPQNDIVTGFFQKTGAIGQNFRSRTQIILLKIPGRDMQPEWCIFQLKINPAKYLERKFFAIGCCVSG
jgi:hypothetical protein